MEVYRGDLAGPRFQSWLETLLREGKNKIVIGVEDLTCYQAKLALQKSFLSPYPEIREGIKRALIHIMTCQNQECERFFTNLNFEGS